MLPPFCRPYAMVDDLRNKKPLGPRSGIASAFAGTLCVPDYRTVIWSVKLLTWSPRPLSGRYPHHDEIVTK